ncbi:D-alanyl-D-alanine carboxypeptidase, partial [Micromonospora sp. KC723]
MRAQVLAAATAALLVTGTPAPVDAAPATPAPRAVVPCPTLPAPGVT